MIFIADASLRLIEVDPGGCEVLGYSQEEILKFSLPGILVEDGLKIFLLQIDEIKAGKLVTFECRMKRSDGEIIEVELSGKSIEAGQIMFFGHDITQRTKMERELEAAYAEKKNILESITDAFLVVDKDWTVTYWNKQAERMINIPGSQIVGYNLWDVFPEYKDSLSYKKYHEAVQTGESTQFEDLYENDWYEISAYPSSTGLAIYFKNVTARKKADEELKRAYEEKNMVLECIDDGFFAVDNNSIITYWNKRAEILLDAKREDVIGKNLYDLFLNPASVAFYNNYQKAIRENTTLHFEEFSERSKKWFSVSAFPSAYGLSVYFKDVTERKSTEEKIKESELRYRSIVEQATDAICIADAFMNIIEINPRGCQMLGYTKPEFLKLTIADLFVLEDLVSNPFKMEELSSGKVVTNERRFKRKDGSLLEAEISARILEDGRLVVFARDITERKQAEMRLQESNKLYHLVSHATSDMVWDWDLVTGKVYRNSEGWKKIFGSSPGENENGTQLDWNSRVHPDDLHKAQLVNDDIENSGKSFFEIECRVMRDDGTYAYIHDRGNIIRDEYGKPVRIIGATQDITERKEAELMVARSEFRFRSLVQNGSDLINILDEKGYFLYTSPAAIRILGYESGDLLCKNSFAFIHPDDVNSIKERLSTKGEGMFRELSAYRFRNANGEWIWLESKVTDMTDNPEIKGYVFNSRDITERKIAEDEVKKLSVIARETVNAVVITDPEGNIVWVNEAFTRITEYDINEVLGKKPGDVLQGPQTSQDTIQFMRDAIRRSAPFECNVVNYSKSGRKYWIQIQCQPQFDEHGRLIYFFAVQTDITDKITLEHELENVRRLKQQEITEAVITAQERERQQIGSELHDNIIQILAGSRLFIGLAEKELKLQHPYLMEADKLIHSAVTEIRNLSHELIPPSLSESELIGAIENIIKITQQTSGMSISLETWGIDEANLTNSLKLCMYRIVQEQFNNILKHASAKKVLVQLIQDNEKTLLSIKDNGAGFDTSKRTEGVGLLNIKTRASLFNGDISVISSPGNGCELRVLFN